MNFLLDVLFAGLADALSSLLSVVLRLLVGLGE